MTPEEKAKAILNKYKTYVVMWSGGTDIENENVKQCASICVKEIMDNIEEWDFTNDNSEHHFLFWNKVLNIINQ